MVFIGEREVQSFRICGCESYVEFLQLRIPSKAVSGPGGPVRFPIFLALRSVIIGSNKYQSEPMGHCGSRPPHPDVVAVHPLGPICQRLVDSSAARTLQTKSPQGP